MEAKAEIRRVGFCPHCGNRAPQRLVFTQQFKGEWYHLDGNISVDPAFPDSTYYIAVCETCDEILVYLDHLDDISAEYFNQADLIWPSINLHDSVPSAIADCYSEAVRIKNLAPNAFASQIRRALEAICDDRGAKKGFLQDRLNDLISRGEIPPVIGEVTEVLRMIGNIGSHSGASGVRPGYVFAIDEFFKTIVEYVYVAPSKLKTFKERIKDI